MKFFTPKQIFKFLTRNIFTQFKMATRPAKTIAGRQAKSLKQYAILVTRKYW